MQPIRFLPSCIASKNLHTMNTEAITWLTLATSVLRLCVRWTVTRSTSTLKGLSLTVCAVAAVNNNPLIPIDERGAKILLVHGRYGVSFQQGSTNASITRQNLFSLNFDPQHFPMPRLLVHSYTISLDGYGAGLRWD